MSTALASRIQQARIAAGFPTPDAAAIVLAMNPEVYRGHEQGRHKVKQDEIKRYAETFKVTAGCPAASGSGRWGDRNLGSSTNL